MLWVLWPCVCLSVPVPRGKPGAVNAPGSRSLGTSRHAAPSPGELEGVGSAGLGWVPKKSPVQRTPVPASDLRGGIAGTGVVSKEAGGTTAEGARLAQGMPPGRTPAASPGQGSYPARHARGRRRRAPGGGSPSSSDVYR